MVEIENEVYSSEDELINLAYEAESDDEDFPLKKNASIYKFAQISESSSTSESENENNKQILNTTVKIKKQEQTSEEKPQNNNEDVPMEVDDESQFIVIGNEDVGPTCTPMNLKASWIKNAKQFPLAIHKKKNLAELDSITQISEPLREEVRKYTNLWFPVQSAVLPTLIKYEKTILPPRDLVITAPTGSGKTLCFVLPILNALRFVNEGDITNKVFALIIVPVQSLAQQIFQEFTKYNVFHAKIEILNILNENKDEEDHIKIFNSAHIIISTPGRLVEHLVNSSTNMDLSSLRYLVVDEADRMQDTARIEWLNIVERRARASPTNNITIADFTNSLQNHRLQKILVSATLSLDIEHLQTWNLRCPLLFKATSKESEQVDSNLLTLPPNLTHNVIVCDLKMKPLLLYDNLLSNANWKKVLVFVNKKDTSHRLTLLLDYLAKKSFSVAELSTNLFEKRRQNILNKFQNEEIRVLICSDMMSRGIDLNNIDCVINYDSPINERIFIHRAGRTARALNQGVLLSLLTKEEKMFMKKLLFGMNLWTENIKDERNLEKTLSQKLLKNYEKALRSLKEKVSK